LFLANRLSPTRFVYQYAALETRGYASGARVDELVADLARDRPALIVDASADSFVTPPLDRAGMAAYVSPEPQYVVLPEMARVVIEEQVRDRAVRGPGIARIAARTRRVERICGPIESLVAREPQRPFGRQAAVAFLDEQVSAVAQHADRFAEEAVGIRQMMD